jgi:hypothetical protein
LLVVALCCAAAGCGKPLRGVATVIGVRNAVVESPRPPAPPQDERRGAATTSKERAARSVQPTDRPASLAEAPRALGTSGVTPAAPTRPVSPAGGPDVAIEAGATSTSGQGQDRSIAASPGPRQDGNQGLRIRTDRRRLVQLITIPLTVVAVIAAVVVGRRLW